jgi:hypothetical protein
MVKWISLGLSVLVVIVAAIWSFENRYHKIAAAEEMNKVTVGKIVSAKADVSKEVLGTFQAVQQSFKSMQKSNDVNLLDSLRDRKYLLEQQQLIDTTNRLLQEKILILDRQIKRLEIKLCE